MSNVENLTQIPDLNEKSSVLGTLVTKEILGILDQFPAADLAAQQEMAWYEGDDEAVKAVDIARRQIRQLKQNY